MRREFNLSGSQMAIILQALLDYRAKAEHKRNWCRECDGDLESEAYWASLVCQTDETLKEMFPLQDY